MLDPHDEIDPVPARVESESRMAPASAQKKMEQLYGDDEIEQVSAGWLIGCII